MAVASNNNNNNNGTGADKKEDDWRLPPRPSILNSTTSTAGTMAKDRSCQGVLGATLYQALEQLSTAQDLENDNTPPDACEETNVTPNDNDDSTSYTGVHFSLKRKRTIERTETTKVTEWDHPRCKRAILNALGRALLECLQNSCNSTAFSSTVVDSNDKEQQPLSIQPQTMTPYGPAMLFQGRLDCYNRLGDKWRMQATQGILRSRSDVFSSDTTTGTPNRPRKSSSLWSTDAASLSVSSATFLAYGDQMR
jgi:hypothetical protein